MWLQMTVKIPAVQPVDEEDGSTIYFCKIKPCPTRGLWAETRADILDHLHKDHGYVPLDKWLAVG